jgi:hypothetical protein
VRNARENELVSQLLAESREELARADGKASLLLAASTVVIAAALTAVLANNWRPWALANALWLVWWLGVLAGLGALAALGIAVYPRVSPSHKRNGDIVAYWGDVAGLTKGRLAKRISKTARKGDRDQDQLLAIADIVRRKYTAIRWGIWLFAAAVAVAGHYLT